jgi:hypothetical protein
MLMKYTWSYSGISLFKQCPQKYYRLKVVKDIVEPMQEHLLYGTAVHKAAEEYVRDGTPIPKKYEFIQPQIDALIKIKGDKYCEYEMGLTENLEPCGFKDPKVWWRGIVDLAIVNREAGEARIVDYKTGRVNPVAVPQLDLYALVSFVERPDLKTVESEFWFLDHGETIARRYVRDQAGDLRQYWETRAAPMLADETFNPRVGAHCRWCPFGDLCGVKK